MTYKAGDRVFAILSADKDTVKLIGKGEYLGQLPFRDAAPNVRGPFGLTAELVTKKCPDYTNPCIRLDDGSIVWGCECWWGREDKLETTIGKRKVVNVDMEKERNDGVC